MTSLGVWAFHLCNLSEVVIPSSVRSIGKYCFYGNSRLKNVYMGSNVTMLDDFVFERSGSPTVYITAENPPYAYNTTFSSYAGGLYVQGEAQAAAYAAADSCWYNFEIHQMIEPEKMQMNAAAISGRPGDTIQLTASLLPENVTMPQIFWRSTNPEVATVDHNGLVTIRGEVGEVETYAADDASESGCRIIAESLYRNGPVASVTVTTGPAGIEAIVEDDADGEDARIDYSAPVEIYNLSGVRVGGDVRSLVKGIYIVRQGRAVEKIVIR